MTEIEIKGEVLHLRTRMNLFIGTLGCIFGYLQFQWAALIILVYLFVCWFENARHNQNELFALSLIWNSTLIFSVSIYMFGQYIFALPHGFIRLLVFALLTKLSLSNEMGSSRRRAWSAFTTPLYISVPFFVLWFIPLSRLTSFLGFGYDNYAHLMMIRKILIDRKGYSGSSDSVGVVSILGGTASGAHALIAILMESIGIDGLDFSSSIRFYALAVFAIPIIFTLFAFIIVKRNVVSVFSKGIVLVLIIGTVFGGYLSHIWFSGYFASNFATVMLLITLGGSLSTSEPGFKLLLAISAFFASILYYPVYAIFFVLPIVALLAFNFKNLFEKYMSLKSRHKILGAFTVLYLSGISIITVYGIQSGPLGGFLTPGGIAPVPIGITALIFGISIALMNQPDSDRAEDHTLRFFFFGSIGICLVGISYAFENTNIRGEYWEIPYYPAKMTITVVLLVLVFLIDLVFADKGRQFNESRVKFINRLLVCGSVAALIAWNSYSWPFANGYMGNTEGVIKELIKDAREVVDVNSVLELVSKNPKEELNILYLSETHESELNTRWINSLLMNWTDENWTRWRMIRQTIESDNAQKHQMPFSDSFLIVIDDYKLIKKYSIDEFEFENVCHFDEMRILVCL
jgi:hypothetical protein